MAFPFIASLARLLLLHLNRHCEPTGRANARPMTGSAKQSNLREEKLDCFVASLLAMTALACHFGPDNSFAACPNIFFRASSSNGAFTNFPIASPACTCGRARTSAYQRLTLG